MKNCRNCVHWDHRGADWGYCTLITGDSSHEGVNLLITGLDNYGEIKYEAEVTLETTGDFGCIKNYTLEKEK